MLFSRKRWLAPKAITGKPCRQPRLIPHVERLEGRLVPTVALGSLTPSQWTAGQPGYTGQIAITGGTTPYALTTATGLPDGLTASIDASNDIVFSGTPNIAATYSNVQFTVQDAGGSTASGTYTITINPGLSIGPIPVPVGEVGLLYNPVFTLSGGTTPYTTFQVTNFSDGGTGLAAPTVGTNTVTFNSTPAAAGTVSFSITATDTAGASLTDSYSIPIYPALTLPATNPPNGTLGSPYLAAFPASGGDRGPYSYAMTPTSFDGLSLSDDVLSGIPASAGGYSFTVQATDVNLPDLPPVSQTYTLRVPPTVSLTALGNAFSENSGAVTITATLNAKSNQTVTIPLIFGGTAPSSAYSPSSATITIPAGVTSAGITVFGLNSPVFGTTPQTLTVSLGTVTNALVGSASTVGFTINPDPNATYVANCYQLLLGRAADPAGFRYWEGQLARGTSPSVVVQSLETSREFLGDLVQAVYRHYLGRAADPAGLAYWSSQLAAGLSLEQMTADILASPEYLASHRLPPSPGQSLYLGFVQALYRQILGRPGSSAEWAMWTRALDGGSVTPEQAARAFLTSREYETALVNGGPFNSAPMWEGFYPEFLHRPADPAGLAAWVAALQNGMSDQTVLAAILGSAEGYRDWS
jgi:hypothetical protein